MKPVIIYSLPRTKSTAALLACKREYKFNEPFSRYELTVLSQTEISQSWWDTFHTTFDHPNSATKLFGSNLETCSFARDWFSCLDKNSTHDVFVLVRDLKEICFSFLLAQLFGFNKKLEVEPNEFIITEEHFFQLLFELTCFFRFMPKNGTVIEFDTLPKTHFDRNLISSGHFYVKRDLLKKIPHSLQEQHSLEKLSRITNIEFVNKRVDDILQKFKSEWTSLNLEAWQSG